MAVRFPQVLWIVPTNRCNTRCRTCAHYYLDYGQDMSPELFAKIDSQILDHVKRVHLVGAGEPLISAIFPDMLEACIRRKIKIFFITNSIALNEELVRKLVRNDAEIMISVDGATAATYNSIRPLIPFKNLLSKLEMIKNVRHEYPDSTFRLLFNTVVMQRNMHELPQLVEMAMRYEVDNALFSDFIPNFFDESMDREAPCLHQEQLTEYASKAMDIAERYKLQYEIPQYYTKEAEKLEPVAGCPQQNPILSHAKRTYIFPKYCTLPWTHANIMANGNVSTCCNTEYSLGNLNEQSFQAIWNGAHYTTVRRLIRTNNPPQACTRCNLIAGIGAGNSNYFSEFCLKNHLEALDLPALGCCVDGQAVKPGQDIWLEKESALHVNPGTPGAFMLLHLNAPYPVSGVARLNGRAYEFCDPTADVLLRLPPSTGTDGLTVRFTLTDRIRLLGIDLLSDDYMAENAAETDTHTLLETFRNDLAGMRARLEQAVGVTPGAKTFAVFGANTVGEQIKRLGEELGLSFIGYLDNFVKEFEFSRVVPLQELAAAKPDIVCIASKSHAAALTRQVLEQTQYPRILTFEAARDIPQETPGVPAGTCQECARA